MAKFVTDASGATWRQNLEPMQVAFFFLAEEITQVKEAILWVRCASGNVCKKTSITWKNMGVGTGDIKSFYDLD